MKRIIILLTILLSSCTVTKTDWDNGCDVCKEHDGLKEISFDIVTPIAKCNNGKIIRM